MYRCIGYIVVIRSAEIANDIFTPAPPSGRPAGGPWPPWRRHGPGPRLAGRPRPPTGADAKPLWFRQGLSTLLHPAWTLGVEAYPFPQLHCYAG